MRVILIQFLLYSGTHFMKNSLLQHAKWVQLTFGNKIMAGCTQLKTPIQKASGVSIGIQQEQCLLQQAKIRELNFGV